MRTAPAKAQESATPCARQDLSRLTSQIQRYYQATGSFRASFAEQITPFSGAPKTRHGKIYFQRPGKMRWDFAPPDNETIVSDGTTLYSYQPDLNQVVEVPISKAFSSSVATAFLLGVGRLQQDFQPTWPAAQPTDGSVSVVLKPKPGQGSHHTVGLEVDPRTCSIKTVRIEDQIGNVTTIQFLNPQTNVALDASLFYFKIPPGADVIHAP
jgi:outer membrane lipoprotein carrier protein